tara:strand:+ start:517 stop:912 length:396 start_codon:yes stop_codon:yes gene_type:complete
MKHKNKIEMSSNRSFGVVFFVVFFLIGIWPIFSLSAIRHWFIMTSLVFLILGLLNSNLLTPFNKIWYKIGILLGNIISPIIMLVIFFLVVTPTGFILRIFKKDLLNLKTNKNKATYWIDRNQKIGTMRKQY